MTARTAALLAACPARVRPGRARRPRRRHHPSGLRGLRLGVPQDQIPDRLHANDHRINEWQAQRDVNWPIIEGDCG